VPKVGKGRFLERTNTHVRRGPSPRIEKVNIGPRKKKSGSIICALRRAYNRLRRKGNFPGGGSDGIMKDHS